MTAILLTVLFRFLVSNARFENKIEQAAALVMQRQRVQERLETVLTNLEPLEAGAAAFYTLLFPEERTPSLIVSFNAGIDPDPDYSHALTGRLHVTKEGDFCFSYWPRSKEGYRTEVLLRDVRHLQWEFLGKKEGKLDAGVKIAENWAWLNEWSKKQGSSPTVIRLRLWCGIDKKKEREPNLQFAFILPLQDPIAVYCAQFNSSDFFGITVGSIYR